MNKHYEVIKSNTNITNKDLFYDVTIIDPGNENNECYHTKGHIHKVETGEVYHCLEGEGIILQELNNITTLTLINQGSTIYIQPNVFHRAINIGKTQLKLLCVGRADAGHNYEIETQTHIVDARVSQV